ncbi:B-cell receptor CD22 [Neodiprion lecontei]|uniref:B-cell receptor CD22 n=1 Tax=Neodiprion lecontei TaxID=441921 RepID=A0ABM3GKP7_NEOLC|nr:B-cell receptor CD22 [Neodiprion lecontei]
MCGCAVTLIFAIIILNGNYLGADDSIEFQNKLPAKLIWAVEGDHVELPCDVTPPRPTDSVSMVLWFKDDSGIPLYSLDARGGVLNNSVHAALVNDLGKKSFFLVGDGHQRARLKIANVTFNDQGVFRCRVDFANSPTRNYRVNLTLVEQPTNPVIYDAQGKEVTGIGGPFLEGYDLFLSCQVAGGRPKPSVTWWRDGQLLDGVVDSPIVNGASGKFTVNQLFVGSVTRALWGAKLECRAQAGPLGKPVVREVPLDIYLKPAVVKIVLDTEVIYAGRPVGARCETWGSSPAARIVWMLDGNLIRDPSIVSTQRSNSTVSKLALVVGREDDAKELTCRAENPRFPGGVLEHQKVLRVSYAPVVLAHMAKGYDPETLREGDDLKLVCEVDSNPRPDTITWYHDEALIEHNVTGGTLVASETLTLRSLTLAHSGEYICVASNAVGEGRSHPVLIHMKYAPRCREGYEVREVGALRQESLSLRCEVEAVPGDTVRFSWTFNGTLGDVLPLPGTKARNKGLTSTFEYTVKAESDFGTLACWASNSVGRQRRPCLFNVVPAKKPEPPLDCSLRNESSALEVNCVPGSDGGLRQHFVLEVRGASGSSTGLHTPQNDQGVVGEAPPICEARNQRPFFQLHCLEAGFEYTMSVFAVNEKGRSDPVLLENVRIAGPPPDRTEKSKIYNNDEPLEVITSKSAAYSVVLVVALIGGAALVLVGIGIMIGLVICRRRNSPPPSPGPDDFTTPTYVPAQRIEPRVKYSSDRRRSYRTSLFLEESRHEPDLLQQVELDLHS